MSRCSEARPPIHPPAHHSIHLQTCLSLHQTYFPLHIRLTSPCARLGARARLGALAATAVRGRVLRRCLLALRRRALAGRLRRERRAWRGLLRQLEQRAASLAQVCSL